MRVLDLSQGIELDFPEVLDGIKNFTFAEMADDMVSKFKAIETIAIVDNFSIAPDAIINILDKNTYKLLTKYYAMKYYTDNTLDTSKFPPYFEIL